MARTTIHATLQIVAVISMLIGAIMTTMAAIAMVGHEVTIARMQTDFRIDMTASQGMGIYGLIAAATPILWGAALFASSHRIVKHIGNEMLSPNQVAQRTTLPQ